MLKERLRPSESEQQSSFFDVEVNLKVPCVVVSPSLDEIQEAVNTCAKKVMSVTSLCGVFWSKISRTIHRALVLVPCNREFTSVACRGSNLAFKSLSLSFHILLHAAGALSDEGVDPVVY